MIKKLFGIIGLFFLFLFTLSIYTLTLRGVYGNIRGKDIKNNLDQATKPFELSPERGRFLLTMSLGENKSFALSKELADAAFPDVGYYQGRFYVYFAPGISLMALPFYLIGKQYNIDQVAAYFMIAFISSLNAVLLYQISRRIFKLPFWASVFIPLLFAFGTTAWSYAITLYQHQVTTFLILSSFYAIWKYRQRTRLSFMYPIWVWFAYGWSIAIDYPNAILMLPVMIYLAISAFQINQEKNNWRVSFRISAAVTAVVFFALMALHGYYNYVNFGDWKRLSGSLVGYKTILNQQLLQKQSGQNTINQLAQKKENVVNFFSEELLPASNTILLFSRDRGLFIYMPIFVFAVFGILKIRKKINLELGILLGLIGVNLFLYSSWGDPWGGWAYGTRYLIPSMAYLSIFVGIWIVGKNRYWKSLLAMILFSYSSAVALLGALTTNAVPPKVEADYLHMKYNFLLNLDYFQANRSGSFVFNHWVGHYMNLTDYFLLIYTVLAVVIVMVLFILPIFSKHETQYYY